MKLHRIVTAICFVLLTAVTAHAGLNTYLQELNACAKGDIAAYQSELCQRFAISVEEYNLILQQVASPAEVAVVLWLSEHCGQPAQAVLQAMSGCPAADWEMIATVLGLAAESEDILALHYGELDWYPVGAARYGSLLETTDVELSLN